VQAVQGIYDVYERASTNIYLRGKADILRFFDGLELVAPHAGAEPVLSFVGSWGAEDVAVADTDGSRVLCCGVARVTGR
jgi:hypothetical protein